MRIARADLIDGREGAMRWPVQCWRTPQMPATLSSVQTIYGAMPPTAAVDFATEFVGAQHGYSIGDVIRRQRGRHAGGVIAYAQAHFAAQNQFGVIASTQSSYFIHKTSGGSLGLTVSNLRNRLYGFWPADRAVLKPARTRKESRNGRNDTPGILRRRAMTPWISGTRSGAHEFDMSPIARGDEPMMLELWGRCRETDLNFVGGDEIVLRAEDVSGTGGGEIWHSKTTIGFYVPASVGWAIVSAANVGGSAITPSKWEFQLRAAWASDPFEDLTPTRTPREGVISWWESEWRVPTPGRSMEYQIPAGMQPIDIFTTLRCTSPDVGYLAGDRYYGHHSCQFNIVCIPTILIRGRKLIIPLHSSIGLMTATGSAGGQAITPSKWELKVIAIG